MPFPRNLSNRVGRWLFEWALGQPVPDNQSGYRLISARLMAAMLDSPEQGFQFEVEMIVTCVQRSYRLEWIPIQTIYQGESSHVQPLRQVSEFLGMVWKTGWATRYVDTR